MADEYGMTIDQVLEILPQIIQSNPQHRVTVELEGPPGGGKSTVAIGMPAKLAEITALAAYYAERGSESK